MKYIQKLLTVLILCVFSFSSFGTLEAAHHASRSSHSQEKKSHAQRSDSRHRPAKSHEHRKTSHKGGKSSKKGNRKAHKDKRKSRSDHKPHSKHKKIKQGRPKHKHGKAGNKKGQRPRSNPGLTPVPAPAAPVPVVPAAPAAAPAPVHPHPGAPASMPSSPSKPSSEVKYTAHGIEHIKQRHWHDSKEKTSKFSPVTNEERLGSMIRTTLDHGRPGKSTNQANSVKEYTFSEPIGTTNGGREVNTLRVVTNPAGEVVTAFPIQ